LGIEIRVTHAVETNKVDRLQRLGLSAFEIDLSDIERIASLEQVDKIVCSTSDRRHWLFHVSTAVETYNAIQKATRRPIILRELSRHVDRCPLEHWKYEGSPYANVNMHCMNCQNALEITDETVQCNAINNSQQADLFSGGDT